MLHEAIRKEGEDELLRSSSALAWSSLAAGLSMGFSLVAQGLLQNALPDQAWRPLISMLGYSIGFLIVILGRQQLFTENTITPILPLLARRNRATLFQVGRLWIIVLAGNLVGTAVFAWVIGSTGVFRPDVQRAFAEIGREVMDSNWLAVIIRSVFAGWLIALMVWMLPGAQESRVAIIIIITYLVGLAGLSHIIAGSVEVLYLVVTGGVSVGQYLLQFMLPTLAGNIIGGTALVAALNHAQVAAGEPIAAGEPLDEQREA